jgi:hypothetical protein
VKRRVRETVERVYLGAPTEEVYRRGFTEMFLLGTCMVFDEVAGNFEIVRIGDRAVARRFYRDA